MAMVDKEAEEKNNGIPLMPSQIGKKNEESDSTTSTSKSESSLDVDENSHINIISKIEKIIETLPCKKHREVKWQERERSIII